jgi:hypothetical protein
MRKAQAELCLFYDQMPVLPTLLAKHVFMPSCSAVLRLAAGHRWSAELEIQQQKQYVNQRA